MSTAVNWLHRASPKHVNAPSTTRATGVQAEVFIVRLSGGLPELAGPFGPDPWYMAVGSADDPVEVVGRLVRTVMGEPLVVHSTSWRHARGSLILSFIVVQHDGQSPKIVGIPIPRTTLARSLATQAPAEITPQHVLEHGLRHLAWLARDDATVQSLLCEEWKRALGDYLPQPFRNFG